MAYNKIEANGETLIDLTSDTVTAGTLLKDVTAHDRSGVQIKGTVIVAPTDVTETEDNEAYLYKSSEHDAVYDELVGGSVAWNQLVANSGSSLSVTITSGHKYVIKKSGTLSVGASSGSAITGLTGGTDWITDLTLMFDTTIADYVYSLEQSTAGSGIVWLKSYGFFTKDYYAYNAGGLVSANVSGKKVVGKNLLKLTIPTQTTYGVTYISDRETGIVTATGTGTINSGAHYRIPIPAELVGNYYFSALTSTGSDSTYDAYVWCNTDNARAKKWNGTTNSSSDYGDGNCEIRLEAGKTYTLNLRVKKDITVNNLVFKPMIRRADVTDSTFEPYTSITYPIQSTDLRGLFKLNGNKLYADGDIYPADGNGTRKYEMVDLGTLKWEISTQSRFVSSGITSIVKIPSSTAVAFNGVCQKYLAASNNDVYNHTISNSISINGSGYITIYDVNYSSYADANAFKTAMSGVYLVYELATPTTATAQPFASPQMVYRNGTEEYLDTRDVPIPVGGNRKYVDIPDWMVNEYFDNIRADSSIIGEIKKEADTLEEHLKAFIIESNIGDPTRINNTSDFTVELFDKIWGTNTDLYPRFAHLYLFGNEAHFLKAIIESIVVDTYTPTYTSEKLIQATFISEMSMYYFRWVRGQAPSMNKYTISVT